MKLARCTPLFFACALTACDDEIATTPDAEVIGDVSDTSDTSETPDTTETTDATPDVPETIVPGRALGLNDVTFLLPPNMHVSPVGPLVPTASILSADDFARVVTDGGDIFTDFANVRIVAIRVDLCDRHVPGPCPEDADASLRIVLQPLIQTDDIASQGTFEDVAVHAFFPIPKAELPALVATLRDLAALGDTDPTAPLGPSTVLAADPEGAYAAGLAALVSHYAAPDRLLRLTCFGQFSIHAALHWLFRGIEKKTPDGPLETIVMPDIAVTQQEVLLLGNDSYEVTPIADAPPGIMRVVLEDDFVAASLADQRQSLEALAAVDNPLMHTPDTVQCMACHVTTQLMESRAPLAGIDPDTVAHRYESPLDPRPFGDREVRLRTLRALGYIHREPLVSQRVANESAQVVHELTTRFGAADADR